MVGCRILASRVLAIMAAVTTTGHTSVIEYTRRKTAGDMAHRTIVRRRNMIHRLAGG